MSKWTNWECKEINKKKKSQLKDGWERFKLFQHELDEIDEDDIAQ